jgi:hypothetical protein
VRLQAARAVAPEAAGAVIEYIANSRKFPQAGEAGMTLVNLVAESSGRRNSSDAFSFNTDDRAAPFVCGGGMSWDIERLAGA